MPTHRLSAGPIEIRCWYRAEIGANVSIHLDAKNPARVAGVWASRNGLITSWPPPVSESAFRVSPARLAQPGFAPELVSGSQWNLPLLAGTDTEGLCGPCGGGNPLFMRFSSVKGGFLDAAGSYRNRVEDVDVVVRGTPAK